VFHYNTAKKDARISENGISFAGTRNHGWSCNELQRAYTNGDQYGEMASIERRLAQFGANDRIIVSQVGSNFSSNRTKDPIFRMTNCSKNTFVDKEGQEEEGYGREKRKDQ
jgi:hypothetical protein